MRRLISLLLFLSMSGLMTMQRAQVADSAAPDYDIIIRNGRVVDGSGRAGFNADIAIKDDHIARIGNLRGARARCRARFHRHARAIGAVRADRSAGDE